jgi:hypothetical protein
LSVHTTSNKTSFKQKADMLSILSTPMPSEAIFKALYYSGGPNKIQKLFRISIEQRIEGRATSKRPTPEKRHKDISSKGVLIL